MAQVDVDVEVLLSLELCGLMGARELGMVCPLWRMCVARIDKFRRGNTVDAVNPVDSALKFLNSKNNDQIVSIEN